MNKNPAIEQQVELAFEGRRYQATYVVESKVVTVQSSYGTLSSQLGNSPAPSIARILLGELILAAKARGEDLEYI